MRPIELPAIINTLISNSLVSAGHRVSDLVFFIRNLRRHFGDQRAEVQRAIRGDDGGDAAASPEHMLDRYFGRLFPSLVVYLWRTKAKVSAGSAK